MIRQSEASSPALAQAAPGYRQYTHTGSGPNWAVELPADWTLEELPLVESKGKWVALRGPLNESGTQYTTLSVRMYEKDDRPKYESLDAFASYAVRQLSIGKTEILSDSYITVAGLEGREVKFWSSESYPYAGKLLRLMALKQCFFLVKANCFFEVCYHSQDENFEAYLQAYQRAKDSFNFAP